jgi:PAS domain S-box-containing protein
VISRDIQDAVQSLAQHQELEIFRRVFFASPDYIAFSRLSDGTYIDVNPGFERLLGHRREDVIGRTSFDIRLWPDEDGAQRAAYVEMLKRDGAVNGYEARICTKDGEILDMETSANVVEIAGVQILIAIAKDITARKRTERELIRLNSELVDKVQRLEAAEQRALDAAQQATNERRRMDALLEAVPVGIVVADVDGELVRVNAAHRRLWGEGAPLTRDASQYADWRGWWADGSPRHGERLGAEDWAMARALRGEEAPRDILEIEPFGSPGERRTIVISGAPVRDGGGRIVGGVVAQMDITDRVRAEAALRQADRRKDEFLAMLAHELRNPLAPISAAAELMELAPLDQARLRQTSRVISRQVQHMNSLVDDLLDVSRLTRGLVVLRKDAQDLKTVVANAVEQVRPMIAEHRHHLAVDLPACATVVAGDHKRLVQIVSNLLNNAAKYTPAGGNIRVVVTASDTSVMLCVEDDGIGMPADLQERVFDLFVQAERASDRSQGGLGLGLALVRNLAELHGGSVSCRSAGPGKGSSFLLTLPRMAGPEAPTTEAKRGAHRAAPAAGRRVLIVDDNEDAASMLGLYLEEFGHEILIEHCPLRALEKAREVRPQACLLDIGLPGMDGNELARMLRAEHPAAMLIALTGYGQESDRKAALAAGFDHHLVKPVDTARLTALLSAVA